MKLNKAPWADHVFLSPGTIVTLNATLKSKFGTLTVDVFSDEVDVVIDGKIASKGSLTDFMIPGGMHDIGARNGDSTAYVSEAAYIRPGENVHYQARLGKPSMTPFRSMALPGLGQTLNGAPGKGFIIMGGFAAACAFTVVASVHLQSDVDQYNSLVDRYRAARGEDAAKIAGDNVSSQYETVRSSNKVRTAGFVLAGAVYVYSLLTPFSITRR